MNRCPAEFTMIEPGRLRSARQNQGPLGSGIVGPHQASSISATSAPAAMPARWPPPVLAAAPVVHSVLVGVGWNRCRSSRFFSNPPLPRMTPRRARITRSVPSWPTRTPVTRPSSTSRSRSSVSYCTGTPASISPCRNPMASALPIAYILRPRRLLTRRVSSTRSIVSGPLSVRRPRLILRKSAWVTIRFAGALVYAGCSRSSSSPRKLASSGTGSTLRPRTRPPGCSGR